MRIIDQSGSRDVELKRGVNWVSDGTEWHEVINIGTTTGVYLLVEPNPK